MLLIRCVPFFSLPLLHRSVSIYGSLSEWERRGHPKDSLDHQELTLDSSQSPLATLSSQPSLSVLCALFQKDSFCYRWNFPFGKLYFWNKPETIWSQLLNLEQVSEWVKAVFKMIKWNPTPPPRWILPEKGEGSSSSMMHYSTQTRERSRGLVCHAITLSVVNLSKEKGASTTLQ